MDRFCVRMICLLFLQIIAFFNGGNAHCDEGPAKSMPTLPRQAGAATPRLNQLSLSQLERRLAVIDEQLSWLCPISLRGGVGSVGGRSKVGREERRSEWFQIELSEQFPIQHIVLVPTIWRDTKKGLRADGFPLEFKIVVGTEGDSSGTVVASFTADDGLLPRIAPLVVQCPSINASWVRIEATRLTPRLWDSRYVLQLSEVLVFSGHENVALNQTVKVSSKSGGIARKSKFLVDGFVPYLLDAMEGERSIAFLKLGEIGDKPEMSIDLGDSLPLNRIHIHAVDLNDTVPQAIQDGYGMPRHLLVEGANQSDFSDAIRLLEYQRNSFYDNGPIIMRRFPKTPCRYVRLIAIESDTAIQEPIHQPRIGFAEIEIFSEGKNVCLGKQFLANFEDANPGRTLSAMTDGRNFYGSILPIRDWLIELARRHDLETERPLVVAELNRRYANQNLHLTWVTWLAVLLAIGIGVTIMIDRIIRMHQLANLKERFAADLHDELGANLHVIGLLGDLAQTAVGSPEKLKGLHQRIRVMTERSGIAVQNCTDFLEAKGLYLHLYDDMQRTTQRIMADVEGELSFQGNKEVLQRLKPRTRADLFLFYKECLVNIGRHSQAPQFSAQLTAVPSEVNLIVSDNGHGLPTLSGKGVPPSLLRRARLLGAEVTATCPEQGGTRIQLDLQTQKWGRRK